MRSSTEVYWRNRDSAGGSRDRSSKRKYCGHEFVVAGERRGARRAWCARLHRQRSQVKAGGPALRALGQLGQLVGFELDTCRLQQQPGLALVQPQVRHADLVHTSLRPPAGKRQLRRLAARDRDLRAGRKVFDQCCEHVQTGQAGDSVQIVEHQHQRALERSQCAPDTRDAPRPGGSPRARQRIHDLGRERFDAMDRGGDVPQEHRGVAVARVEPDPGERTRIGLGPRREQRRLAVPGGRDHGREARGRRTEPCDQVRLRHRPGPRRRRGELEL